MEILRKIVILANDSNYVQKSKMSNFKKHFQNKFFKNKQKMNEITTKLNI